MQVRAAQKVLLKANSRVHQVHKTDSPRRAQGGTGRRPGWAGCPGGPPCGAPPRASSCRGAYACAQPAPPGPTPLGARAPTALRAPLPRGERCQNASL